VNTGSNEGRSEGRSEGRNEGRNEGRSEAINEAINEAVNDQRASFAHLFRHFTASWRNKCRGKYMVSSWCLRIVFLLSAENKNDNRN
jgi:hypothetical protein